MLSKPVLIPCTCRSLTHVISFQADIHEEDGEPVYADLLVGATMNHYLPWYRRLKVALYYFLGRDTFKYEYTEVIVHDKEDLLKMRNEINKVLKVVFAKGDSNGES